MTKNRYIKLSLLVAAMFVSGSCSDDFLDVDPVASKLEINYYQNQEEAYAALVAAYDPVGWIGSNYVSKLFATNVASDDFNAGGGSSSDQPDIQAMSNYSLNEARGPQGELWNKGYSGIFRANILMEKLPGIPGMSESLKTRYNAEAKFLRAFYYFDLIRFFYKIPLMTETILPEDVLTVEQVEREQVYEQIETDLLDAIPHLPATVNVSNEGGRATEGAARALLGKLYLEMERFSDAAAQFEKVNGTPGGTSQYGYSLLDNFADLFKVGNEFNSESIFEVAHSSESNTGWDCIPCTEGNVLNHIAAPRSYTVTDSLSTSIPRYVSGYGFCVPTQGLADAFNLGGGNYDPRYSATLTNLDSLQEIGAISYGESYQNSGYVLRKFAGTQQNVSTGSGAVELNFPQNTYEIRLADTYLLEAEALVRGGVGQERAQSLLDAVRERVGLESVPVNMDNILRERRLELAGEGQRWFDLMRNGRVTQGLTEKGFTPGKNERLPIPLRELTDTMLEQDPNY
ncbi:RagB/SusD family nutrient uptake outer membrane protein [Fulvivirga maritima]|uniref:RagB/SusD family nutrient uptake outer membrane protein n=1 Tax=Fulvivirga maritima TaxID=2904247 RepID=UPI001F1E2775|nr:RagB/SusD family nutrient uptake outer membrane protein [Fulvivirga maritima]UII26692.1 RagB/SusD family nutrient uptake outer membrane protein [Fulvivirga maritima]